MAVNDEQLETAIEAITAGAKEAGGWGRIFVTELQDVITIWTGERGPRAIG